MGLGQIIKPMPEQSSESLAPAGIKHFQEGKQKQAVAEVEANQQKSNPVQESPSSEPVTPGLYYDEKFGQRVKSINAYLREFEGLQFTNELTPQDLEQLLEAIRRNDEVAIRQELKQLVMNHKLVSMDPANVFAADLRDYTARIEGFRNKEDLQDKKDAEAVAAAVASVKIDVPIPKVEMQAPQPSHPVEKAPAVPELQPAVEKPAFDYEAEIANRKELAAHLAKGLALLGFTFDHQALADLDEKKLIELTKAMATAFADPSNMKDLQATGDKLVLRLEPIPESTPESTAVHSMPKELRSLISQSLDKVATEMGLRQEQDIQAAPVPKPTHAESRLDPENPAVNQPANQASGPNVVQEKLAEQARTAVLGSIDADIAGNVLGMDVNKLTEQAAAEAVSGASEKLEVTKPLSEQKVSLPAGPFNGGAQLAKDAYRREFTGAVNEAEAYSPAMQ